MTEGAWRRIEGAAAPAEDGGRGRRWSASEVGWPRAWGAGRLVLPHHPARSGHWALAQGGARATRWSTPGAQSRRASAERRGRVEGGERRVWELGGVGGSGRAGLGRWELGFCDFY
jgi:hypothetical protein